MLHGLTIITSDLHYTHQSENKKNTENYLSHKTQQNWRVENKKAKRKHDENRGIRSNLFSLETTIQTNSKNGKSGKQKMETN